MPKKIINELSCFPKELQVVIINYFKIKENVDFLNESVDIDYKNRQLIQTKISLFSKLFSMLESKNIDLNNLELKKESISKLDNIGIRDKLENIINSHEKLENFIDNLKNFLGNYFDTKVDNGIHEIVDEHILEKLKYNENPIAIRDSQSFKGICACHHSYKKKNDILAHTSQVISARCHRKENKNDDYTLNKFNMVELISWNKKSELEKIYKNSMRIFLVLGELLGNNFQLKVANDSFMTDNPEKILFQMLNAGKIELKIYSKKADRYISVASFNWHGNYYTNLFYIKSEDYLESVCLAFGVERIINIIKEQSDLK